MCLPSCDLRMLDTRCCPPVSPPLDTRAHYHELIMILMIWLASYVNSSLLGWLASHGGQLEYLASMKMFSVQVAGESISIQAQIILLLLLKNTFGPEACIGEAAADPARVVRRCPNPPLPQHVPFYCGTAVSPHSHCATRTPEDAPRQLDGGGGTTTCPPDHLGPPVGAPAELLRATSVGRHPPTGHQLPLRRRAEPRNEQGYNKSQHFSTTFSVGSNFATAKRLL